MGFKNESMLFDYIYLLKEFDPVFFGNGASVHEFIFPINNKVTGRNPGLFEALFKTTNKFCFCIPSALAGIDSKTLKEEIIQNIVRLLFLPNYIRIQEQPVFFIEAVEEKSPEFEQLVIDVFDELKKQGIKNVIVEELKPGFLFRKQDRVNRISAYSLDLNQFLNHDTGKADFESFTRDVVYSENFYKRWIIPVTDPVDLQHKIEKIGEMEARIEQVDPFLVRLICMYRQTSRTRLALESENAILKFKLETSAYSLRLIREESINHMREVMRLRNEIFHLLRKPGSISGDNLSSLFPNLDDPQLVTQLYARLESEHKRASTISEWYKKEYEVLPMWYKRFGHLIKVFKGERTFKSLFK